MVDGAAIDGRPRSPLTYPSHREGVRAALVRARGAGDGSGSSWSGGSKEQGRDRRHSGGKGTPVMHVLAFGARHERQRRVPVISEHQTERGLYYWVHKDKTKTTKLATLKNSTLCNTRFSENRRYRRCSMK